MPIPKPIPRYPRTMTKEAESDYRSFAQRYWLKIFLFGLFACIYGSGEFFAGKVDYPNLFDSPLYAPYIIFVGLFALFAGLFLRLRVSE